MKAFKTLLLESGREETFKTLLKNEYHLPDRLLVRGSDHSIEDFKEFKIRKDRKPRDTSRSSNAVIAALEDGYYTDRPKRRESKFATLQKNRALASKFGDSVNYVFPHKSAKIASFYQDSIEYTNGLAPGYSRIRRFISESEFPILFAFIEVMREIKQFDMFFNEQATKHKDLYSFIKQNWPDLKKETERLSNADIRSSKEFKDAKPEITVEKVVNSYQNWVQGFENYFSEMIDGIPKDGNAKEVMFDGPKYLEANQNFFQSNFDSSNFKNS